MNEMLMHLKICIQIKKMGLDIKLLKSHKAEEIADFLDEVQLLGLPAVVKALPGEVLDKLIKDIGFCQILQWLLEEGVPLAHIQKFVLQYPGENPSVCDYATLREVLSDDTVNGEYLYEYWKYYHSGKLDGDEKQRLWTGLRFYHERTDAGLEDLSEKRRKYLFDPIFAARLLEDIDDMELVFAAFENKEFMELLQILQESTEWGYWIGETAFAQMAEAPGQIGKLLKEALPYVKEDMRHDFLSRWVENRNLLYDLEKLVRLIPGLKDEEQEKIWGSRVAYIGLLYGNTIAGIPLEEIPYEAEKLLIYAVTHKKRHFLELAQKHGEELTYMGRRVMLADEDFYQRFVNLNTLNERNLLESMEYRQLESGQKEAMENREYTFEEIRCFYGQDARYIRLYHKIAHPRVDDRLAVFREIIKKQCLPEELSEKELETLGAKLTEKKLSVWLRTDFAHIRNLELETAVRLLIYKEELSRFLPEIESGFQAEYVLKNREQLAQLASMGEFNQKLLETDRTWLKMKRDFQYPEELVEENRERILKFLFQGGAEIMTAFYQDGMEHMEKARRLVTAEILGRFRELKYHEDDLAKELDFQLTDVQKANWMQNERKAEKAGVTIWEEDALIPVMQIGEVPTQTCMSYRSGVYKGCLLSCFDANKKVIFASLQGKIVFRAILRLTKKSDTTPESGSRQEVEFVDMLKEQENETAEVG